MGCRFAFALLPAALSSACGQSAGAPPASPEHAGAELDPARYFPLIDGHIYEYVTRTEDGDSGRLIARAIRPDRTHGELRLGRAVKRFEYTPDGVMFAGAPGTFVLKAPLTPGSSWRGEHGIVKVVATGVAITVPAGKFSGCVQVSEQRSGDRPMRSSTTFCPDVGIAILETTAGGAYDRAELRMHGPPVEIGPDGLVRVP